MPGRGGSAANLIRVNDHVLMRTGFPQTEALLRDRGYNVITVQRRGGPYRRRLVLYVVAVSALVALLQMYSSRRS